MLRPSSYDPRAAVLVSLKALRLRAFFDARARWLQIAEALVGQAAGAAEKAEAMEVAAVVAALEAAEAAEVAEAMEAAEAAEVAETVEAAGFAEAMEAAEAAQAVEEAVFINKIIELDSLLRARSKCPVSSVPSPHAVQSGFDLFKQDVLFELGQTNQGALTGLGEGALHEEVFEQWRHVIDEEERTRYRARAAEEAAIFRLAAGSQPRRRRRGARRGCTQGGATARPTPPLGEG
jgi:hypothetical protein